jgi:beta-glucanase (GH16 family)
VDAENADMKLERFAYCFGIIIVLGVFLCFATIENRGNTPKSTSAASYTPSVTTGKRLVFSDEFNRSTLDSSKWVTCYDWRRSAETGCTNSGNFEQQWYTTDQLSIHTGQLFITANNKPIDVSVGGQAKTFAYQSGMISSGRGGNDSSTRWAGTYGYYEAKLKFGKQWPPEIDIAEFVGGKPNEILQTLHWQQDSTPLESSAAIKGQDYSGGWHTYGLDWREDGIDWYIDGIKTRSYTGPHVPNQPMEIILNLAIGGTLPGNATKATPFPQTLQADYIRVYQSKDQIRPYQH